MAMAGDGGLYFAWRVAVHLQIVLRGSQQNYPANFRESQSGAHIQCSEDALDGHDVGRKFFDQAAEKRVDVLQSCARTFLLPLGGNFECTIMQHTAEPPVAFDDPVSRGSCGRGVHTQDAQPAAFFAHCAGSNRSYPRHKSTAFCQSLLELCLLLREEQLFAANKKGQPGAPDWPKGTK